MLQAQFFNTAGWATGSASGKHKPALTPKYPQTFSFKKPVKQQEGQHPLTGQRAANFRLLANQ